MLKRKHIVLIATAIAASFGTAYAADDKSGVPGVEVDRVPGDRTGVPGVDMDITARMGKLDIDSDKYISKAEADTDAELKVQFGTLDKNKDGRLSKDEYTRLKVKTADARGSDRSGLPGIEVDRVPGDRVGLPGVDVDITAGKGKPDRKDNHGTEVSAVAKDKDDGGVPGIDVDRVPGDRTGIPGIDVDVTARIGKLDKNGDKSISKAEARADKKLNAEFKTLDTNNDGVLDSAEFARFEVKADVEKK